MTPRKAGCTRTEGQRGPNLRYLPPMNGKLIWPSLFTLCGVLLLLGLGGWQLQRLAWKEGLIARIEARAHGDPSPLAEVLAEWRRSGDVDYRRVQFSGRFLHDKERHLYWVLEGGAGWRVVTPLVTEGGAVVLVDRGFVPQALKNPAARTAGQPSGTVRVIGLARAPGAQALFTPDNDPVGNMWYWRDLDGMAASVLSRDDRGKLVPFFVEAEKSDGAGGWPAGGVTRLTLPNKHFGYALTWFGLAAALVGVFVAFVVRHRKDSRFT